MYLCLLDRLLSLFKTNKLNMSEELKQHILKNGLTLGGILVAITTFTYIGGPELVTNYAVSIGSLVLMIAFPIYHTRRYRTTNDGFISFREAFTSCTGILIAAGFINTFASILLYNIIDPGFGLEVVDAIINKTVAQLEGIGAEESLIEQTIKTLEEGSSFEAANMFKGYIFSIIFYTVFGLLVAAFTKNEKPEFSEE
jgi:hypothetical protein|tara:strand:+ start:605 stop:1198 length:594 start_codon:yes stop_codon:yes gene_type:complete